MSSQGPAGVNGYKYPILRDAQDRTRQIREQLIHRSYETGSKKTFPASEKRGNAIRISYNFGHLSCLCLAGCDGNAFNGVIPQDNNMV